MKAPLSNQILVQQSQFWRRLLPLLALFVTFGTSFQARAQQNSNTRIVSSTIIIDRGTGNEAFDGKNSTPTKPFNGAELGTFNINSFNTQLLLNGGTIVTQEASPDVITATGSSLRYRLSRRETDGSFTDINAPVSVNLPLTNTSAGAPVTKTFSNMVAGRDLLVGLTEGEYFLFVQHEVNGSSPGQFGFPQPFTLSDPPNSFYIARFVLQGVRPTEPPTSTTWTGGEDDNWFDARNWTQGVPTKDRDATIPDFGSGSTVQYPNIYSDAIKPPSTRTTTIQNTDGTTSTVNTPVPGYDNTGSGTLFPGVGSGPAQTRTLTMRGTSQAQRSITRLIVGRLNVFGDFNNQQDSFIQRENTIISFKGANQSISGSASGLVNVEIDGGGIKTLVSNFAILPGGTLRFINGILETDVSAVNVSFVELFPSTTVGTTGIPSGRIAGETETTFLRGYIKIAEVAQVGVLQDFGNIGITLTFQGNGPGVVAITRNTAENFASINNGANGRPSIRRIFGVRPSDQQTNTGGLNATLSFRYLDNELTNLRPNNQTLDENKLALFVSTSGGDTFGQLGRDELSGNVLTKNNVRAFATFTLSELTAPLPVTLTAFNAKRVGTNAEITWETVTELNSRGYEVQVSNDGRNYRMLTFVASTSPNSNQLVRYRYIDTEAGKTGVRYYRLRQIDLDGTDYYYAPKAVTFDGAAELGKAEVRAFPNPFGEVLTLMANTSVAGPAQLSVTDMTGRVVGQQTVQLTVGNNDVSVPNVANLRSGIYLVHLVMPSGEAKVLRVSKQ